MRITLCLPIYLLQPFCSKREKFKNLNVSKEHIASKFCFDLFFDLFFVGLFCYFVPIRRPL